MWPVMRRTAIDSLSFLPGSFVRSTEMRSGNVMRGKSYGLTKKLPLQFVTKHLRVLFASSTRTYA